MPSFSAELGLLRHAARVCLAEPAGATQSAEPDLRFNWSHVLWLGRRHGMLLFLREALRRGLLESGCPADVRAQLDELSAAAKLQALDRTAEVCRLHDRFEQAGIPWALIDPWMFQACFHSNRILTETVTEIRCILHPEDAPRAREVLALAGHKPVSASFHVAGRHQTPVELVTDLSFLGAPEAFHFSTPSGFTRLALGGRSFLRLGLSDWLRLFTAQYAGRPATCLSSAWQVALLAHLYEGASTQLPPETLQVITSACTTLGVPTPGRRPENGHKGKPPALAAITSPAAEELPEAPFVPTPPIVCERMLKLAGVTADDIVFDLGCGDGQIVVEAALRHGARATGVDCNPALLDAARARAEAAGVSGLVTWTCADLFSADASTATVICLYLLPAFYPPVREFLLRSARPGARIVSHNYLFPDWPPEKTELVRSSPTSVSQIYLWRIP